MIQGIQGIPLKCWVAANIVVYNTGWSNTMDDDRHIPELLKSW